MSQRPVPVIMPKMGESINEATISAWRKKVGEYVEEGEALLDISTSKVESEIPSPVSGTVLRIDFQEGDVVAIDEVICLIAPEGADLSEIEPANGAAKFPEPAPAAEAPAPNPPATKPPHERRDVATPASNGDVERERQHLIRRRSTPLVRNIAQDLGIDITQVRGTGIHGRVTKQDIEAYLAEQKKLEKIQGTVPSNPVKPPADQPVSKLRPGSSSGKLDTVRGPYEEERVIEPEVVTVTLMRRTIADNLTRSAQTIPHAYTVHEVDFTHLEKIRVRYKPIFEQQFNTRLTPLVFLVQAVTDALLKFPSINASWMGDRIEKHKVVNIGIAVAIREGLVVPVLKNVESMSLAGIARGLVDLATRARSNSLRPSDVEGGTFTVTSPGQLGALMAVPIILPPQGGIIHLGAIQKVPTVVTGPDGEDSIAIRQRAMMTLGIDHRLIDGWEADQFMVAIKQRIERADFGLPS